MTKYREIIRLTGLGFSQRNIMASCGVAQKTVVKVQKRASEYSCAMKSHFRKFGNQMSGSGNHLCKVTLALIYPSHKPHAWICHAQHQCL